MTSHSTKAVFKGGKSVPPPLRNLNRRWKGEQRGQGPKFGKRRGKYKIRVQEQEIGKETGGGGIGKIDSFIKVYLDKPVYPHLQTWFLNTPLIRTQICANHATFIRWFLKIRWKNVECETC